MNEPKNIFQAMNAIMADIKPIAKNRRNTGQGFMFRGIDEFMNELHTLMAKHHVFVLPKLESFQVDEKVTTKDYNGRQSTSITYYTRVKMDFAFVAEDGSSVTATTSGEGMDNGDKSMNKAMSAALKYALMQTFLVPTEDTAEADETTPTPTRPKTAAERAAEIADPQLRPILDAIAAASSQDAIMEIWKANTELQSNQLFKACCTARKLELK